MSATDPADATATLPLTGGCGCGAVRFEVTAPLDGAGYCHCTRCQRRSGTAASANGRLAPGSLRIVQGEDRVRAWSPEGGFEKLFCGDCGSALFSRPPGATELAGVRLGAFDDDPGVRPGAHQFVAYAAAWEPLADDGLPRYAEGTGGELAEDIPVGGDPGPVELPLAGGCGCGAVRFEVDTQLVSAGYCHCTRCQRRSGTAASANALLEGGSLRILQGEDRLGTWSPEDGNEKLFCADCGSALFTRRPGEADMNGVRLGAFDGDPGVRPRWRQFLAYAVPWEPIRDDGLPRYPERRLAD